MPLSEALEYALEALRLAVTAGNLPEGHAKDTLRMALQRADALRDCVALAEDAGIEGSHDE